MLKKRTIVWIVIILSLVGGYFYYRSQSKTEPLQTETVKRGDVSETISISGELVPSEYADLSFQGAGTVNRVSVKEGDAVRAGQVIASLDSSVLQSQLNEARIAQAIAEQDEKLARHGWDDLKREERNVKKLASEQARENVRTVIAQINDKSVTSPIDGTLSRFDVRTGEVVTLGEVIARVAKTDGFIIEARVPESDIVKVMIGMQAKVTFDAFLQDEVFDAAVVEIDRASTTIQDVVSYVVKFRLDKTDDRLKDGMTANIDIETAKKEGVLIVPFRTLAKEGGKTYAEVSRGENQLEKVEVTTGVEGDEGMVEITSGLQEGDEIVTSATQKK